MQLYAAGIDKIALLTVSDSSISPDDELTFRGASCVEERFYLATSTFNI